MADITLSEEQLQTIITQAVTQAVDGIVAKTSFADSEKAVGRTAFDSTLQALQWYSINQVNSGNGLDSLLGVLGQVLVELNRLYIFYTDEEFNALLGGQNGSTN